MPMTVAGNDAGAAAPQVPQGEIRLEPPPELPEVTSDGLSQALMYLPMGAMAIGMVAVMAGGKSSPVLYIGSGAMAFGMVGMMFGQVIRGKGDRKLKLNGLRRDYLRYLGQIRRKVRRAADEQRRAMEYSGPAPRTLTSLLAAGSERIWQRSPADAGFGCVRFATGTQAAGVRLVPPETKPIEDLDPLCAGALRRFIRAQGQVPGLPVEVSLPSVTRIVPTGDPGAVRALVRSMIAQVAVMHSPADVRISVCASADRIRQWEWIKWLPHNMHPTERDAAGAVRLMTPSLGALEPMLQLHDRPRFMPGSARSAPGSLPLHVVLVDGAARDSSAGLDGVDGVAGVVVIDLSAADLPRPAPPGPTTLGLRVTPGEVYQLPRDGTEEALIGVPDALSHPEAEALARQLAPLRPAAAGAPGEDALALNTTLTSLLGIDSLLTLDVAALRRARAARDRLRVPIGNDADGLPVELDIKESAQGGMGPHGLVVAAVHGGRGPAHQLRQPGSGRDHHRMGFHRLLGGAPLVQAGVQAQVGGNVLDQAPAQGHVEHLRAPADAQDRQAQPPGLQGQRYFHFIPGFIQFRGGVQGFRRVPAPRVDIAAARQEQAGHPIQGRYRIPGRHQQDAPGPSPPADGREVVPLRGGLVSAGHEKA